MNWRLIVLAVVSSVDTIQITLSVLSCLKLINFILATIDTSWFIANSKRRKVVKVNNGTYGEFGYDKVDTCLSPGDYNFTVYDQYGDGE